MFADAELNKTFEREGVVLVDLLDENDLAQLGEVYQRLDPKLDNGFYTSLWSADDDYREASNRELTAIMLSKAKALFHNYTSLFADLIVKRPTQDSHIGLHQDWQFVSEPDNTSLIVWCPLVDITEENGALQVVKRSHRFYDLPRGANIPPPFGNLIDHIKGEYLDPIYMKRGQALIFDHSMIHGSEANKTPNDRVACGLVMVPEEAQLYHYHRKGDADKVEKIKVDDTFYLNYNFNKDFVQKIMVSDVTRPPGGETETWLNYEPEWTTQEEFDELYRKYNQK